MSVTISGLPPTSSVDPTNAAIPVTNAGTTYKASPTVLIGSALGSPPPIGNTTPNTGSFTTMSISGTFTLSGGQLIPVANGGTGSGTAAGARTNLGLGTISTQNASAVAITGGTVDGTILGGTTPAAGTFTNANATVFMTTPVIQPYTPAGGILIQDTGNNTVASFAAGSSKNVVISPASGNVTVSPTGTGNVVINPAGTASTIDNVVVGSVTPKAGTFTDGVFTNSLSSDGVQPIGTSALSLYNSTGTAQLAIATGGGVNMVGDQPINISPLSTLTIAPVNAGTINNMSIGQTTKAAGSFTTLASTGATNLSPTNATVTLAPTGGSGSVVINPTNGTMDNVVIGGTSAKAGTFTSVTATTASISGGSVSNATITGSTIDNSAIVGGTIDGAAIGATTQSSGAFTTLSATSGTIANSPVNPTDIVNKTYADSLAAGLQPKQSCVCATTADIGTMPISTLPIIDGHQTVAGDRVLVKNQTAAAYNGIWVAQTTGTAWVRSSDMAAWSETLSAYTLITTGSTQAGSGWLSQTTAGGTINVTPITFAQFSSAVEYNPASVAITGGTIDGTVIGGTTQAAGSFTTLQANTNATIGVAGTQVNGVKIIGATTGNRPDIIAYGTDTNVPLGLAAQGNAAVSITNGATGADFYSITAPNTTQTYALLGTANIYGATNVTSPLYGFNIAKNFNSDNSPSGDFIRFLPDDSGNGATIYCPTTSYLNINTYTGAIRTNSFIRAPLPFGQCYAAVQNITNATDTIVNFTSFYFNNSRLTVSNGTFTNPTAYTLWVIVNYTVSWDNNGTGARASYLTFPDTATSRFGMQEANANTSDYTVQSGSQTMVLTAGSTFTLKVWQNSGSTRQISGAFAGQTSGFSTKLTFSVIGATG